MSVYVAEYLGQRVEATGDSVSPETERTALCPFMDNVPCKKLSKDGKPPVCAVRKAGRRQNGLLWISCSKRLCASEKTAHLSSYQIEILFAVAKILYGSGIVKGDVCVKAEVPIRLQSQNAKPYRADYIFALSNTARKSTGGPSRLVVEMQGGGETSYTKQLTDLVRDWEEDLSRTNTTLQTVAADVGTLETNAWRRQQEQFLVKGSAAKATNNDYGIALCVGDALFSYIENKIGSARLRELNRNFASAWTLAIIPFKETNDADSEGIKVGNSIPLKPDPSRTLFMDYNDFVNVLVRQGGCSDDAFTGSFFALNEQTIEL